MTGGKGTKGLLICSRQESQGSFFKGKIAGFFEDYFHKINHYSGRFDGLKNNVTQNYKRLKSM